MADHGKADYDVCVIDVSPSGMLTTATQLVDLAQDVEDSLGRIHKILDALQIAWQGRSATDAEEVNRDWVRVATELFGTKEDPKKGVLPTLISGLGSVATNFTTAEDAIAKAFSDFRNNLAPGSGGSETDDTPPKSVTDTNKTAITMTFG
ncbi:WXG100 family type VII secretion target [Streptomyces sp. NPDC052301]|uniref:WXG100 family type VII secretion target n=1 Tax=Streptomyces sp. NPDC052301 TaxID=3365687 RepID=UPI0037D53D4E